MKPKHSGAWVASLGLLLGLSGCGGGQELTTKALHHARRTWQAAHVTDYNLEWRTSGAREGHYLVYVRGGRVRAVRSILRDGTEIEARPAQAELYSVDGLFQILEE